MLLVCAVILIDMKRRYHDSLCGSGECDGDGQFSVQRLSTWHRRSPVAIPKSYLGRGLDRPETPEANNEAAILLQPYGGLPLHMPNRNESSNHVILLPQSYNRHRAFSN